jgi:hypothetical protein
MAERLNRKELYDLVWSEPMKTLSARFGISDVALKKACARIGIPTPERRYWAKKDAGKEVLQATFPLRAREMSDEVEIGARGNASYGYRTEGDFLAPIGDSLMAHLEPFPSQGHAWLKQRRVGKRLYDHTVSM